MSDNNSSDNENVQEKVTTDFKKKVLKWLEIDDEIRSIRAKSSELTKEKKQNILLILDPWLKELILKEQKIEAQGNQKNKMFKFKQIK